MHPGRSTCASCLFSSFRSLRSAPARCGPRNRRRRQSPTNWSGPGVWMSPNPGIGRGRGRVSETRTYVRDGENVLGVIQRVFPDGRRERIEYTANYDREYPVTGTEEYDHVVLKRIDRQISEALL